MLGRKERLQVAQHAAGILRETGALDRVWEGGYTRIDPFKIAIDANLAVMKRPLDNLLGGFFRDEQSGILVNVERPPGMVHMTCAHELGHFFLGHETTFDHELDYQSRGEKKEREADWFAYHLLMPRALIVDVMRRKGWRISDLKNPDTLYQLSLRLGTSYAATFWTLMGLNMLSASPQAAVQLSKPSLQRMKRDLSASTAEQTLSDVWVLDENDRDRVLEPRIEDRFVLDLPSHASAGYLWSIDEALAAGFQLRPLTVNVETISATSDFSTVVGGQERQRYLLEHDVEADSEVSQHRFSLAFKETQPWRTMDEAADSFTLSAEFESMSLGLDQRSRQKLVAELASA